jgi:glucose/mannose-6-phosphate isomerase
LNLDDLNLIKKIDQSEGINILRTLHHRFKLSYMEGVHNRIGQRNAIHNILLTGMGPFEAGARMFLSCVANQCQVPAGILDSDNLPEWIKGPGWLIIALMGKEDEDDFIPRMVKWKNRECQQVVLSFTTPEALPREDEVLPCDLTRIRCVSGWEAVEVIGILAGLFSRMNWLPDMTEEVERICQVLQKHAAILDVESPVCQNPVKRAAGQMVGRWATIFGADHLAALAQYWKIQLNRIAKTWSQYEIIPGSEYSTPAGLLYPSDSLSSMHAIFLKGSKNQPQNLTWLDALRRFFMQQGINTDFYAVKGDTWLEEVLLGIQYGDFLAYFLAIANGVDPAPGEIRNYIKFLVTTQVEG